MPPPRWLAGTLGWLTAALAWLTLALVVVDREDPWATWGTPPASLRAPTAAAALAVRAETLAAPLVTVLAVALLWRVVSPVSPLRRRRRLTPTLIVVAAVVVPVGSAVVLTTMANPVNLASKEAVEAPAPVVVPFSLR